MSTNASLLFASVCVFLLVAWYLFVVWYLCWGYNRKNLRMKCAHEARQRQKLLDRQNNVGRRIYNALDRVVYRLGVSKCVVEMCENDDQCGFQILVMETTGCTIKWLEIHVDLVHRLRLMNCLTPIRVHKKGQWFEELWPESDVAIEELISSLENYILELFTPAKV